MIYNKKILGLIPARGGSKGVPGKNIKYVNKKPLIYWTIQTATKSKYIDRLILSSEDQSIINIAKEYGLEVPFIRPRHLAEDLSTGDDVALHAIKKCPGFDIIVLLQPTSPLRIHSDIDGAIEKMVNNNAMACVSVSASRKYPNWLYHLDGDELLVPIDSQQIVIKNRQELPLVYALNGSVFVAMIDWYIVNKTFLGKKTISFIIPNKRSIDIDNDIDFVIAEALMKNN
tara:strand:- start:987 stop:1673 length:687 start_codon:yes stop_codon:yes gene_type:complete